MRRRPSPTHCSGTLQRGDNGGFPRVALHAIRQGRSGDSRTLATEARRRPRRVLLRRRDLLTLSSASGGSAYIADATATGTIENNDPLQRAWLSRFGRAVATQAVDAITGRMEASNGSHVTVGGMQLNGAGELVEPEDGTLSIADDFESLRWNDEAEGTWSMSTRELLLGSSLQLSAEGENGLSTWTGWGRVSTGGFDADVDGTRVDRNVTSGFLGGDVGRDRWLAGLAVSFSSGDGATSPSKAPSAPSSPTRRADTRNGAPRALSASSPVPPDAASRSPSPRPRVRPRAASNGPGAFGTREGSTTVSSRPKPAWTRKSATESACPRGSVS